MSVRPAISVVLPVYNGARFLRQALASIRWQTFADWECVCVNDGSSDESGEILEQFRAHDDRFRVIHQANQGIVGALNHGVLAANAPWIARMDADDVALPERLATQLRFVSTRPDCLAAGADMLCIDPEGQPVAVNRYAAEHDEVERRLLHGHAATLAHPTVLMRRDEVIRVGLYRHEYEWVEDTDLWLRLARRGRLANVSEILLQYRLHDGSVCWNRRALQRERLHAALVEAYRERGLPIESIPRLGSRRPQRPGTKHGKYARRAAGAGYYRTAWVDWQRQFSTAPLSGFTARITLEIAARSLVSLALLKRGPVIATPDWRAWDCGAGRPDARSKVA